MRRTTKRKSRDEEASYPTFEKSIKGDRFLLVLHALAATVIDYNLLITKNYVPLNAIGSTL